MSLITQHIYNNYFQTIWNLYWVEFLLVYNIGGLIGVGKKINYLFYDFFLIIIFEKLILK